MNVEIELNNTVMKTDIEFNDFIHGCLHKISPQSEEKRLYSQAKIQ